MDSPPDSTQVEIQPTSVRKRIIAVSVLMAFMLYLDRVCLGEIVKSDSFLNDFKGASREQIGEVLGAFFFAYALFQVPSGWASDRFGGRIMLTFYILAWSLLTGWSGMGATLGALLVARLAFGVAQAGAYATSSGVIRNWFHFRARAQASSFVSIGGRLGGTLAPFLTTFLVYQLSSWRYVLYLYCVVGLIVAVAYYVIVRNRPEEHAGVNDAELELIGRADQTAAETAAATTNLRDIGPMMLAIIRSRSLWLNSLAQFCLVFGWAFLITWLPTFLKEERGVEALLGSLMVTGVLAIAIPGQLIGGWLGNHAVVRLGHRWGRIVPLAVTCCLAGFAYLGCLSYQSVWWVVACCAMVSLMTDIGNPTVWAFMQDVGGRNTAAVFGWGNMWGNFGAAASSIVVPRLMTLGEASGSGETYVFVTCAGMYFLAAIAVLGTDATRQVRRSDSEATPSEP
ncbi:MFS transporter [Stieleria magnilauensis]|uniref:Sulfoacetate transporter SauU n=1 Tax=Stieleria magnilauensis TaxID=2527963 RepID=A0ABX5XMA1_9BACT|nr:putative sulfoacetate transporter SauU [Planctomycetes bacterium TBK1r]